LQHIFNKYQGVQFHRLNYNGATLGITPMINVN